MRLAPLAACLDGHRMDVDARAEMLVGGQSREVDLDRLQHFPSAEGQAGGAAAEQAQPCIYRLLSPPSKTF